MKTRLALLVAVVCCGVLISSGVRPAVAQQAAASMDTPTSPFLQNIVNTVKLNANITYLTANNYENKLDVYVPTTGAGPFPTLVYFHGGGWANGSTVASGPGSVNATPFYFLPFLDKGWAVVNVDYSETKVASAPGAVEDCRCALRWTIQHAKDYKFDTNRIVTMGNSAGAHLALTTGMIPASAGLDSQCPGNQEMKVAAILDWYGPTDVTDLLPLAPNYADSAIAWLGTRPDRDQVAKLVSPTTYVRPGLPPIFMVQGDADPSVPYAQSVKLKKLLDAANVPNELITIPGGQHGRFNAAQMDMIFTHMWAFLGKYLPKTAGS